jgi:hydrogenase maturation protease
VARQIRTLRLPGVQVLEARGDLLDLLAGWQGAEAVILVDAVSSGRPPGTIHRVAAHREPLPRAWLSPASTHALGLAEAVELARALHQLPPHLLVFGIEGKNFAPGDPLSPEVLRAVPEAVRRVRQEVQEIRNS